MELDEFMEWYANRYYRKTGKRPAESTMKGKRARMSRVLQVSGASGLKVLCDTCRDDFETLADQVSTRMTTGSLRHVYDVLRDFEMYCIVQGWTDQPFVPKEQPPRNPQKPVRVYTAAEIDRLVNAARGRSLRWWAFLATLSETGRRVGEVLRLEWDWLRTEADVPHFELPTTKNGRQAYVPLTRMLREDVFVPEHIVLLHLDHGRLHGDPETHVFPWTYSSVIKMFRRHCELVGVEDRGFHCFRHSKATEMLARGVPIQAVSSLLGHASVQTTDRIYNHATALSYAHYVDE